MKTVTSQEIWDLVYRATQRAGFLQAISEVLADSTTEAELHGKSTVGLNHLFYYFQAAKNNLINVTPAVRLHAVTPSMLNTNGDHGPMQFAYHQSEAQFIKAAQNHGIAMLMIKNAFAGGELGYFARRLAKHGLVSLSFANGPAVMSVGGSFDRLVGTNPVSYGIPLDETRAIVIDQASAPTARSNFQRYAEREVPIPEGWALNRHGQPTTNAADALEGTLLPFGGYKGGNIALMVEFFAMLGGGDSSYEAAPYFAGERKQGIGASIIAIDAQKLSGYTDRIDTLVHQFIRDRGSKIRITDLYLKDHPVEVSQYLWSQLDKYSKGGTIEER